MIDRETVKKLAKLARIEVREDKQAALVKDLESILGYVSELSKVSGVSDEVTLEKNINNFREDNNPHISGEYTDKILAGAPRTEEGYILVKQVMGEKSPRRRPADEAGT